MNVLALNLAWEAIPDKLTFKVGSDYKKFTMNSYEFRRINQSDTIFPMSANTIPASLTTMVTGFGKGQSLPAGTPTAIKIETDSEAEKDFVTDDEVTP